MDAFEPYFEYSMGCVCGIPRVTLTGTVEDWQRMRSRVEVLATYDLEWWISRVRPILDEFVSTAEGNPNRAFWRAIYKPEKVYLRDMLRLAGSATSFLISVATRNLATIPSTGPELIG